MTAPPPLPEPALSFSFLGYALRLAEPRALRLLLVVLALAVLGAVAVARRRRALVRATGALAPRVAPGANRTRPAARVSLALLGLALLAVALSRPQCGTRTEIAKRYGADLVVVLDASRSMLAADVKPDRLARAKLELGALLDGLGGDRVGIVVFAGDAFVQCPLTTDHAAAKLFLRAVEPDALPRQGTALARALLAAREVLSASDSGGARAKVVLVVSDGEDHEGGTASAAQALAQDGVRVFALAVGTPEGAPVPPRAGGAQRARDREPVLSRLDRASLQLVAEAGDGEVYDVSSTDRGLPAFRAALDRMERTELDGRLTVTYEDRYALAAFPGFLLLLASLLVREGRAPTGRSSPLTLHPSSAPWVRGASGERDRGRGGPRGGLNGALAILCTLLLGFSPFKAEEENVRAGNERLRSGDPAAARRSYDDAERAVGAHPEIDFDRGNAAFREGRLDEAREAWSRAARAAPAPLASRALQNVGNALAAAGDEKGAARAFADALVKDPANEDARWNLEVLQRKASPRRPPPSADEGGGEREKAEQERSRSEGEKEQRERGKPEEDGGKAGEQAKRGGENREHSGAERRNDAGGAAGREPLSRQETEALLDALRAREKHMPFFGRERAKGRRQDAAKDW